MPRNKKKYHRATSDIEDSTESSEDETTVHPTEGGSHTESAEPKEEQQLERKQLLKNAILRRNQIIRQQKEQKAQRGAPEHPTEGGSRRAVEHRVKD